MSNEQTRQKMVAASLVSQQISDSVLAHPIAVRWTADLTPDYPVSLADVIRVYDPEDRIVFAGEAADFVDPL